jgi:hypothetical protein
LWLQLLEELPSLHDISISRFVLGKQKIKRTELHGFCDASQAALALALLPTKNQIFMACLDAHLYEIEYNDNCRKC